MKRSISSLKIVSSFYARRQAIRAPRAISRGYATATGQSRSLTPFTYGAIGVAVGVLATAGILRPNDVGSRENGGAPSYADKSTMLKVGIFQPREHR